MKFFKRIFSSCCPCFRKTKIKPEPELELVLDDYDYPSVHLVSLSSNRFKSISFGDSFGY